MVSTRYLKPIVPQKNRTGYLRVQLGAPGKRAFIHRLVASLFLENPKNYPIINHKDGDRTNNSRENLEWCNASYNARHAYENGLHHIPTGEESRNSKLTLVQVKAIRQNPT
ncbi:MAG: HNH endonuclease, partial [Oscillospiraceae bacterium]|nr:HNH endonuclease [Oscillospiraceae bacterium]